VEQEEAAASTFDVLKKKDKMVVCRICKGDHWTLKCPYKDTLGGLAELASGMGAEGSGEGVADGDSAAAGTPGGGAGAGGAGAGSGKYVPPNLRGAAGAGLRRGEAMGGRPGGRGDDDATLRVTNVSDDTQDDDLKELFGRFGHVLRVYVGRDRVTNMPKGTAAQRDGDG
jgi:translation initiation factor 3 subunit G